jgi:hypothetical protein
MTPWEKEKLARTVMEELEPHTSGAWFTPQAIVALPKFQCSEEMALEVFADLIKRKMLVSRPFPAIDPRNQTPVLVSAWSVNNDQRKEIKKFIHDGGFWHMYVSPTVNWFWGISRSRLLIILTFALAAFSGGFLSECGKSMWDLVKWETTAKPHITAKPDTTAKPDDNSVAGKEAAKPVPAPAKQEQQPQSGQTPNTH